MISSRAFVFLISFFVSRPALFPYFLKVFFLFLSLFPYFLKVCFFVVKPEIVKKKSEIVLQTYYCFIDRTIIENVALANDN